MGPTSEGGRVDIDDRGAYGEGRGGGPERVFWPMGKAPKGTYHYGVRWFKGIGSVEYVLRVYRGDGKVPVEVKTGTLSENEIGNNKEVGTITVE